jgi:hypothetical protein
MQEQLLGDVFSFGDCLALRRFYKNPASLWLPNVFQGYVNRSGVTWGMYYDLPCHPRNPEWFVHIVPNLLSARTTLLLLVETQYVRAARLSRELPQFHLPTLRQSPSALAIA